MIHCTIEARETEQNLVVAPTGYWENVRDSLGLAPTQGAKRPLYLASHKPDIPRHLI